MQEEVILGEGDICGLRRVIRGNIVNAWHAPSPPPAIERIEMESFILFAWLDFIPDQIKMLAFNLGLGSIQKHVISKLPNDFIPYINTAASTGIFMAMGNDFQTSMYLGGGTAMVAKLLQTAGKRGIQAKKAKDRDMSLGKYIKYERDI